MADSTFSQSMQYLRDIRSFVEMIQKGDANKVVRAVADLLTKCENAGKIIADLDESIAEREKKVAKLKGAESDYGAKERSLRSAFDKFVRDVENEKQVIQKEFDGFRQGIEKERSGLLAAIEQKKAEKASWEQKAKEAKEVHDKLIADARKRFA